MSNPARYHIEKTHDDNDISFEIKNTMREPVGTIVTSHPMPLPPLLGHETYPRGALLRSVHQAVSITKLEVLEALQELKGIFECDIVVVDPKLVELMAADYAHPFSIGAEFGRWLVLYVHHHDHPIINHASMHPQENPTEELTKHNLPRIVAYCKEKGVQHLRAFVPRTASELVFHAFNSNEFKCDLQNDTPQYFFWDWHPQLPEPQASRSASKHKAFSKMANLFGKGKGRAI